MPKIPKRHLTFISSALAFFSNLFILDLPIVLNYQTIPDLNIVQINIDRANMYIIGVQMIGIIIGSLVFSVWIEKKGRLFILFISVFIYSLGTILGGLVNDFYVFLFLRFIVGIALAPEFGIGLVLTVEMYNKQSRSLMVCLFGIIGFMGIILLSYLSPIYEWRNIYIYSGICSMLVMMFRFSSYDSDIYLNIKKVQLKKLEIFKLIFSQRFLFLLLLILPIYLIVASSTWIGLTLLDKYDPSFNTSEISLYYSIGIISGIIIYAIIGNIIKSRIKLVRFSLIFFIFIAIYIAYNTHNEQHNMVLSFMKNNLVILAFLLGFLSGYKYELIITFMESYATNKRAGATTLFLGLARFSVFVFILALNFIGIALKVDNYKSFLFVLTITIFAGLWASTKIEEEFNKDLNYIDKT